MFSNKNLPKICSKYSCKKCDYHTSKKSSYDDHLLSAKHNSSIIINKNTRITKSIAAIPANDIQGPKKSKAL